MMIAADSPTTISRMHAITAPTMAVLLVVDIDGQVTGRTDGQVTGITDEQVTDTAFGER